MGNDKVEITNDIFKLVEQMSRKDLERWVWIGIGLKEARKYGQS